MEKKEIHTGVNRADPHKWVMKYADYLYDYCLTRLSDTELAKDLVQETFLAALEKIEKFEGSSTEKTWLTSILRNKIIDIYRRKSSPLSNLHIHNDCEIKHDFFQQEVGHWNVEHWPREFGISDRLTIENKELQHILQKCLQKLPPLWHAVFIMKFMDDQEAVKICNELKVSSSNYWVILHRTKVNLRDCLQKNWR
ncbi:MAG: sigma-70 family RNA polymerase sigma factor [Ferruginibacter sp.]